MFTFLICEDSFEFAEEMKEHDNDLIVDERFFENIYCPDFSVDEVYILVLINNFKNSRSFVYSGANRLKLFGSNLFKLIFGYEFSGISDKNINHRNFWCYKNECLECKKLTNMLKIFAEALISCLNVYKLWAIKQLEKIEAHLNE